MGSVLAFKVLDHVRVGGFEVESRTKASGSPLFLYLMAERAENRSAGLG